MTTQELILIMEILSGGLGVIVFIILIRNLNNILAFFFPEDWGIIIMLEADNNIRSWLQKKTPTKKIAFNGGSYNMYETKPDGTISTSTYRAGRLSCFCYNEGESNPMDFRGHEPTGNPKLDQQIQKIEVWRLFSGNGGVMDDILKYAVPVLVIIGILFIIYLITRGQTPPPVAPTG